MTLTNRLADRQAQGNSMPVSFRRGDVVELGTVKVRGKPRRFVVIERKEWEVGQVAPQLLANVHYLEDRERGEFRSLKLVPTGTYEALAVQPDPASAPAERPHRPFDVLAAVPLLAAKSGRVYVFGDTGRDSPEMVAARYETGIDGTPAPLLVNGRPAVRGPAEIVARLQAKGIELSVTEAGTLLATAPGGRILTDQADAIRAAAPLILGYLRGEPVACALDHDGTPPPADTILLVDTPACAAHAGGTLAP